MVFFYLNPAQREVPLANAWKELEQKMAFLSDPRSYPFPCQQVELIETHMSAVFLAGQYAFKLKRPVHFPYLDLSTLQKREKNTKLEIAVNEALAPDLYLDVLPLLVVEGEMRLGRAGDTGEVIDWIIRMKRFSRNSTLEQRAPRLELDHPWLKKIAHKLSFFYQSSPRVNLTAGDYFERMEKCVEENATAFVRSLHDLPADLVERLLEVQFKLLYQVKIEMEERVDAGRIIQGHGDLRPEHIVLSDPPFIFDRLEFSQELRVLDPVDELSFLAMECEFLGRADLGHFFLATYQLAALDQASDELILFYKSYRALLRAKLSLWHLDDPHVDDKAKYFIRTLEYLNLANAALAGYEERFSRAPSKSHHFGPALSP